MKNKKVKKVAQDCLSGSGVPLPGAWNQVPQPQGAPTCPLDIITFFFTTSDKMFFLKEEVFVTNLLFTDVAKRTDQIY